MNREKSEKELTVEQVLSAKPLEQEPDRSRIKWRKQKWKLPKRIGMNKEAKLSHPRPPAQVYYEVLRQAGRNLCVCARCGSDYKITIHHKDGNPFNNSLENLEVLCWNCHLVLHDPLEEGVHDEMEGTKTDS